MAEVKLSTSRGEHPVEIVGEPSRSGADHGLTYPESVPPSLVPKSPSFFKRLCTRIQILTARSGVWGARVGGLSGLRTSGLASGAQQTQEDSEWEVSSRIAASKSTWSEVPGRDSDIYHPVSVPCPSQLPVWKELMESAPHFFVDWIGDLDVGRLIAEGGQAQIFEAKLFGEERSDLVLKVFKLDAGFSLADFKRLWPRSTRKDCSYYRSRWSRQLRSMEEKSSWFVFEDDRAKSANIHGDRCSILGATLLKDGRFAFLMRRYWGDLHTLIDLKVKEKFTHPLMEMDLMSRIEQRDESPFLFHNSVDIMLQIVWGIQGLHAEGVLHRDLKAVNILTNNPKGALSIFFYVADYECGLFV